MPLRGRSGVLRTEPFGLSAMRACRYRVPAAALCSSPHWRAIPRLRQSDSSSRNEPNASRISCQPSLISVFLRKNAAGLAAARAPSRNTLGRKTDCSSLAVAHTLGRNYQRPSFFPSFSRDTHPKGGNNDSRRFSAAIAASLVSAAAVTVGTSNLALRYFGAHRLDV
jgi:hypothetical protein